jgi:hypothetical protein
MNITELDISREGQGDEGNITVPHGLSVQFAQPDCRRCILSLVYLENEAYNQREREMSQPELQGLRNVVSSLEYLGKGFPFHRLNIPSGYTVS